VSDFRYCEFGHLMTLATPPAPWPAHWSHAHEDDAIACLRWVRQGWPDQRLAEATS